MKLVDLSISLFSVSARGYTLIAPDWRNIERKLNNQHLRGPMNVVALNSHCYKLDIYLRYRNNL